MPPALSSPVFLQGSCCVFLPAFHLLVLSSRRAALTLSMHLPTPSASHPTDLRRSAPKQSPRPQPGHTAAPGTLPHSQRMARGAAELSRENPIQDFFLLSRRCLQGDVESPTVKEPFVLLLLLHQGRGMQSDAISERQGYLVSRKG